MLYKNKACTKETDPDSRSNGTRIIWSAEDATQYSFKVEENGPDETVASYFEKNHRIILKYPKMPIIFLPRISKYGGGWFPIEFAYQAFAKSKENSEEMVKGILAYNDNHAGKR